MKFLALCILSFLIGCASPDLEFKNKEPLYTKINIEIAVVGCDPDTDALSFFKERLLHYHICKSVEIQQHLDSNNLPIGYQQFVGVWNHATLELFEHTHRQSPVSKNLKEINIFVAYLPGVYSEGKFVNLAGIQYTHNSFAIFKQHASNVESSVLLHEFGHILGIADDSHSPGRKPSNPDRPDHCCNSDCVMFWVLSEKDQDFDEDCKKEILKLFEPKLDKLNK